MVIRIGTIFLAFVVSAMSANAELATVRGGEHIDFTRLVVESSGLEAWQFGRTDDGYELDLGSSITAIDLERAYDRIPRDRVKTIWRDPASGHLRISLACACHAIAFEFRPGTVVIDIKSSLPPPKSSFENSLDSSQKRIGDIGSLRASRLGYDWVSLTRDTSRRRAADASFMISPKDLVSLEPLQKAILNQISKGATEGVVDIGSLPFPTQEVAEIASEGQWTRLGLGELPGLRVGSERDILGSMTSNGAECPDDEDLDVASWGLGGPISEQLGPGRSGLLAEFDMPVPEAILRAARFHVYLGFGAEARQQLEFLGHFDENASFVHAMSFIVDGGLPSSNPFEGMESCDSAAALWTTLSKTIDEPLLPQTNTMALTRSFSALPPHLRQHLGGILVERFLSSGDDQTARALRDAILRSAPNAIASVSLMDAGFLLAQGDSESSSRLAEDVLRASGATSPQIAIAMVEAAFQGHRKVDPAMAHTIESFLNDSRATTLEPKLLRAFVLSAAMVGDFSAAFRGLNDSPDTLPELWSILLDSAPDDTFLAEAAQHSATVFIKDPTIRKITASRLLDLGFPDLALNWLTPISGIRDEETLILSAKAYMNMRDPSAALSVIDALETNEAKILRAGVMTQLGAAKSAAEILLQIGEVDAGQRQLIWSQDWESISEGGSESWKVAAQLVSAQGDPITSEKIARGTVLLEESENARVKIEKFLESVPSNFSDQ